VTFRGIEVGRVERVAFESTGVRVTLRISRPDMPLRTQDRVAVRPIGIFGDIQVEIQPGPLAAPIATSGATLPVAPPDTVVALRAEEMSAIVRAGLEKLKDTTRHTPRAVSDSHPTRSRP
jgi:ABC-type transporter Mla subunit MlaD